MKKTKSSTTCTQAKVCNIVAREADHMQTSALSYVATASKPTAKPTAKIDDSGWS